MNIKLILLVAVGLIVTSCGTKESQTLSEEDITGTYVREYSFEVKNLETGGKIGMRSIKDTIFIRPKQNGYEVSNNKWRLDDYDAEGWQSMRHSEDRPLQTYTAVYDPIDNSLIAELMVPLYLNLKEGKLFRGKESKSPYLKAK